MNVFELDGLKPRFPEEGSYWIAPDANLIGNVLIASDVSIWFGATLRGDNEPIQIGRGSNIQEACMLHTDMGFPLKIEANCTIGHRATLHGCTICRDSLVGMGATILNGAQIGDHSVVGACALVTERKSFPPYSLVVGSPARLARRLTAEEVKKFTEASAHYRSNIKRYRHGLRKINSAEE